MKIKKYEDFFVLKKDEFRENEEFKKSIVIIKKSNVWSNSPSPLYKGEEIVETIKEIKEKEKQIVETRKETTKEIKEKETKEIDMRNMMSFKIYTSEEDEEKGKFKEEEKIPNKIEGTYIYDYNILNIDEIIKKKLEQDKKNNLIILKNKLEIEKIKISGKQNYIERKNSKKRIEEIEEEIYNYENNIDKNTYINKTKNILIDYLKLGIVTNFVSFVKNNKDEEINILEDSEKQNLRHKIISEYLEIARKYININLVRKLPTKTSCPGCDTKYEEMEMIEDDSGSIICPNCSLEKINIVKKPFYSDSCRVNNSRNNYEDRVNFEKVLMRYQGKQITKPGKELYEKLDEYFLSKGKMTSKEFLKLPLLEDGTKEGTSRDMIIEALGAINCSGYYEDINLILNVFFGWTLPDITHLEDLILKDYDQSQKIYELLPDKEGRKSSLNSQFRLYCLLKKNNVPCKFRDFKIPATPSILEYHKIMWKQICKVSGWEYIF